MAFGSIFRRTQRRESNYRQWSERATVVSYDSETASYDVMISNAGPPGSDISSTNRTIRRVKSLSPDTIFNSGDAILIGYVSEQKEHPIILGQGDHVAPSGNSEISRIGQAPRRATPTTPPIYILDSKTGSTRTFNIACNPANFTPSLSLSSGLTAGYRIYNDMPKAIGGTGAVTWTWVPRSASTIKSAPRTGGLSVKGTGVQNRTAQLALPRTNNSIFAGQQNVTAYAKTLYFWTSTSPDAPFPCNGDSPVAVPGSQVWQYPWKAVAHYDCYDQIQARDLNGFPNPCDYRVWSTVTANENTTTLFALKRKAPDGYDFESNCVAGPIAYGSLPILPRNSTDCLTLASRGFPIDCPGYGLFIFDSYNTVFGGGQNCIDAITAKANCGWSIDVRTTGATSGGNGMMNEDGCNPCGSIVDQGILSVRDAAGRTASVEVVVRDCDY